MRFSFGGDIAAYVIGVVTSGTTSNLAQLTGGIAVSFWTSETGGTQYTDLLDDQGAPVSAIVSAAGEAGGRSLAQLPPFKGPDGVKKMWAQAGNGARVLVVTNDVDLLVPDLDVILPPLTVTGPISGPQTGLSRLYNDTDATLRIAAVRASVGVAPTGALVIDVRRNGASIFSAPSARPTLSAGQFTTGKVVPTELITFAPDDYLSADVVSGSSGGFLVVQVLAVRAV